MPEAPARSVFIALHVPLFAALAVTAASAHPAAPASRLGVAIFSAVHAALHHLLRRAPEYAFHSPLSISLIVGAALYGAVYAVGALRG